MYIFIKCWFIEPYIELKNYVKNVKKIRPCFKLNEKGRIKHEGRILVLSRRSLVGKDSKNQCGNLIYVSGLNFQEVILI